MLGWRSIKLLGSPARMSKVEWREMIYTGRGLRVWMNWIVLSVGWDRCGQIRI